jgi:hypothetical protein
LRGVFIRLWFSLGAALSQGLMQVLQVLHLVTSD